MNFKICIESAVRSLQKVK